MVHLAQAEHYSLVRTQSEANVLTRHTQGGLEQGRLTKSLYKKSNNQRNRQVGNDRHILAQRWNKKNEIDSEKRGKIDRRMKVRRDEIKGSLILMFVP